MRGRSEGVGWLDYNFSSTYSRNPLSSVSFLRISGLSKCRITKRLSCYWMRMERYHSR